MHYWRRYQYGLSQTHPHHLLLGGNLRCRPLCGWGGASFLRGELPLPDRCGAASPAHRLAGTNGRTSFPAPEKPPAAGLPVQPRSHGYLPLQRGILHRSQAHHGDQRCPGRCDQPADHSGAVGALAPGENHHSTGCGAGHLTCRCRDGDIQRLPCRYHRALVQ